MAERAETVSVRRDVTKEELIQAIEKWLKYIDTYMNKMWFYGDDESANRYLSENLEAIIKSAKVASEMAYSYSVRMKSGEMYKDAKNLLKISNALENGPDYEAGSVLSNAEYYVQDFLEELRPYKEYE